MQRRKFISSSCSLCLLGAAGFILPQLTGCVTTQHTINGNIENGMLSLPLNAFNTSSLQIIKPADWYFNIAVQKNNDNTFSALLLQCTHQENQLTPTGNGYHCNLHGSEFDKQGNVRKGPAELPLHHFKTIVNNDQLNIIINNFTP